MRISLLHKWTYGFGDLGVGLLYIVINTYYFYFLVNIAGFSALAAGSIFIVGRFVDALTDPLIGSYSDKLRDKEGRLPLLRKAILPTALCFVLLFLAPLSPVLPLIAAGLSSILFSVVFTCVLMPYLAILPELVPEYDGRTQVIGIKSVFTMLATLVAFAAPPAIVLALSVPEVSELAASSPSAWVMTAVAFAAFACLPLFLLGFILPDPAREQLKRESKKDVGLLAGVQSALHTRGMQQAIGMFLAVSIGLMITNSLLAFFLESVLLLSGDMLAPLLGGLVLLSILTFPVWVYLSNRVGKRGALMIALGLEVLSLLLLVSIVPAGSISPVLLAVVALTGMAVGGITMLPWAMLPDVVEVDQLAQGHRREGLLYAIFTFAQKLATSVGVFANATVIGLFDYQQGVAVQSAETTQALRMMMGPGAALVFLVAIVLTWRFPISREVHEEVRRRLGV